MLTLARWVVVAAPCPPSPSHVFWAFGNSPTGAISGRDFPSEPNFKWANLRSHWMCSSLLAGKGIGCFHAHARQQCFNSFRCSEAP